MLHQGSTQVQYPVGQSSRLGEMVVVELKGRRHRGIEDLKATTENLNVATAHILIDRALRPSTHQPLDAHTKLVAKGLRHGKELWPIWVTHNLGNAVSISQIDEDHAAMVTSAVDPAAEAHGLVELLEVERSAVVGAHGDQALPGVGRSSALVWAAAGGTVPIETTYFRAASTGMLRAMTSDLGIIKKKPDVGLGVVGT